MPYTKAELKKEAEANYFACALLMPHDVFVAEWKDLRAESNDDDWVVMQLSKVFQVPLFSVVMRMSMIEKHEFLYGT